jgi:hypothetical protein
MYIRLSKQEAARAGKQEVLLFFRGASPIESWPRAGGSSMCVSMCGLLYIRAPCLEQEVAEGAKGDGLQIVGKHFGWQGDAMGWLDCGNSN